MEKAIFGQLAPFIFCIAYDYLVDAYDVGDYREVQGNESFCKFFRDMVLNAAYNPTMAARIARLGRVSYTVPASISTLIVPEPYRERDDE